MVTITYELNDGHGLLLSYASRQDNSTFLVVAFVADADPSEVPPVYGTVTSLGNGMYNASYIPAYAGT